LSWPVQRFTGRDGMARWGAVTGNEPSVLHAASSVVTWVLRVIAISALLRLYCVVCPRRQREHVSSRQRPVLIRYNPCPAAECSGFRPFDAQHLSAVRRF